jgi:hypothetical protein
MRRITHRYVDPLDQIWLAAARRIGLAIERSGDVYASTDGRSTLHIGEAADLDADDSLAQMIFHELCHSLVEGEDAFRRPDWGLDNTDGRDRAREHACLRVQAHLAGRHGLRGFLAPTTEYRAFWDQLGPDPLAPRRHPEVSAAISGLRRADKQPWAPHLGAALIASAEIVHSAARFAGPDTLYATASGAPAPHPTGLPPSPLSSSATCGDCAWRDAAGLCRQSLDPLAPIAVAPDWPACARWEAALDCQECGACCRAAYDSVTVDADDPVVMLRPDLVVDRGTYLEVRRAGDRCAVLAGGDDEPFTCVIYADRPRPCREFERGSENCLIARRRVGLSL